MNNKGFTLVELIATILILVLVMSIGAYSIVSILKATKDDNYNVLIKNIKSAVENYRMECKYSNSNVIDCKEQITLGELVTYGFLSGNARDGDNKFALVNPKDDKSIVNCKISYTYSNGSIVVTAVNPSGSCPTEY